MIVLTVDIKSSIYRRCIQKIKKKKERLYRVYTCVYRCVCMDKHVYTARVCPTSSGNRGRRGGRSRGGRHVGGGEETTGGLTVGHLHALDIHLCWNNSEMHPYGNDAKGDRLARRVLVDSSSQ